MLCKKPKAVNAARYPCGRCLPCLINRRRIWSWRMYLESLCHEENCFLTLTYSPENVPQDGCLKPDHVRDWMKRFRFALGERRIRFFLVGEYGERSQRPHYHAIIFGSGIQQRPLVEETWKKGFVGVGECNIKTIQYTAHYVTKKWTTPDAKGLDGRVPEFARMSLRPGIGAPAMHVLAEALSGDFGKAELERKGDVPHLAKMGKQGIPLARYLRQKLRKEVGVTDEMVLATREKLSIEKAQPVFDLLSRSRTFEELSATVKFIKEAQPDDSGRIAQIEARSKIHPKRRL